MVRPVVDRLGKTYGRLVVVARSENLAAGVIMWRCVCSCGNTLTVLSENLGRSKTRSCGCLLREITSRRRATHRLTKTAEYRIWSGLKGRCLSSTNAAFDRYGGRGIAVCERWINSFENFLADMGLRPSPTHSIDRINNDGNYEPDNCRWATKLEQSRNRRPFKKRSLSEREATS